jgi:hypothetical protein
MISGVGRVFELFFHSQKDAATMEQPGYFSEEKVVEKEEKEWEALVTR